MTVQLIFPSIKFQIGQLFFDQKLYNRLCYKLFNSLQVFQALVDAHPALHVFKKEDFPERFHYRDNVRNLAILGYADANWDVYSVSNLLYISQS